MNRRRIASVEAVPTRMAVAYLIIWSYWCSIRSQRIGRVSAGARPGQASGSPVAGRYILMVLIRLIRGSRSKPSSLVMPNPISDKAVAVHVVGLDLHLRAVPDRAVDHRVHLRGRTVQPLGVNHHGARKSVV